MSEKQSFLLDEADPDEPDELDEYEEAMRNCSGFFDGGVFVCMAVGSEDCDQECPFSGDFGAPSRPQTFDTR